MEFLGLNNYQKNNKNHNMTNISDFEDNDRKEIVKMTDFKEITR